MKQYEYKIDSINVNFKKIFKYSNNELIVEKLNELGKEGWELVGVNETLYYFKRELNESKDMK